MSSNLMGQTLNNRYILNQKLGKGNFGEVWQAQDTQLQRMVAIKILHLDDVTSFLAEAQIIARLEHAHILRVYDFNQATLDDERNLPYLVMELAHGGTLAERLQQTPILPLEEVQYILEQTCQALSYIHREGILHLDIKPSNIAFSKDKQVLLMDFGMAKMLGNKPSIDLPEPSGTMGYMPPEQLWGDGLTARADIYAVGVTLHEMLTGKLAQSKLVNGQPILILADELADSLRSVIIQATQSEFTLRYQSAADLFEAFKKAVTHIDTIPHELEMPYGTMRPESPFYIERATDKLCWQNLQQANGSTTVIQGTRQTGKSSLMRRVLHQIEQVGDKHTVFIDFQEIPQTDFSEPDKFFAGLCLMLSDLLGLPDELDHYWAGRRSHTIKCGLYLTQYILPKLQKPLIIALDEVDKMLVSPFRTDFFAMLRVWHNNRAYKADYQRVSLFLSISTEPYLLIDNPNQSPFNVAPSIFVQDFTLAEVEALNELHNYPFNTNQLAEVAMLLNGHPFLTRLALYEVATGQINFTMLLHQATSENSLFGDYLRRYYNMVAERPELKEALNQIIQNQTCSNDKLFYRLQAIGLVERQDQKIVFRNQLYHHYFKERLYVNE